MQEIKPQTQPTSQFVDEEEEEMNDDDDDDDFSFASLKPDASPISAEDAFLNGQIRPVVLYFSEAAEVPTRVSPAPDRMKKSHSTGFAKLFRFGDGKSIPRSTSEGQKAFLFLRNDDSLEKNKMKKGKETASYNQLYGRSGNKADNEKIKRKSYLPYRSNLMAFFH